MPNMPAIDAQPQVNGTETDKPTLTAKVEEIVTESKPAINGHKENKLVDEPEWYYPHPTDFVIGEHPIDEIRSINVSLVQQRHC